MDADRHRLLAIYLNDHLAVATACVGRARSARDADRGTEAFEPLASLCREIEADRRSLEAIMRDINVERSRVKGPIAALGEKAGRLKPNGRLRDRSPLGRVIDLEVLLLGTTGKLRLWTLLGDVLDVRISEDLDELIRRAGDQRSVIEDLQVRAARLL